MENAIDKAVHQAIQENRIVGTVVVVAQDGNILYQKAAGFADRENKIPMKEDEIFLLASITKPMVTAVAMKLVEEGKIKLNDSVTKYFPDFQPKLENGKTPAITIHQLLTHTSGLSYRFMESLESDYYKFNISDGMDQPGLSLDENLKRLSQTKLKFEPGTKWNYSLGMDVLGGILEKVSGKTLGELVAMYVTQPMKMENTAFKVKDASKLATFYGRQKEELVKMYDGIGIPFFEGVCTFAPSRIFNADSYNSGGAGMAGTATDLLKFFETIRKNEGKILKKESINQMMKDQVGEQAETQGPGWGFGYGWAVLDDAKKANSPQSNGTIQWGGAYGHRWFIDPEKKLTVIALTNTTFEGMNGKFPEDLTNAIYESLNQ